MSDQNSADRVTTTADDDLGPILLDVEFQSALDDGQLVPVYMWPDTDERIRNLARVGGW